MMNTEKRQCCCGVIPTPWWWLLALLGLGLLSLGMLANKQKPIEQDLEQRTTQLLNQKGYDWAKVNIENRGRDVLLSGIAPNETVRQQALEQVQGLYGVRDVEMSGLQPATNTLIKPPAPSTAATGSNHNTTVANTAAPGALDISTATGLLNANSTTTPIADSGTNATTSTTSAGNNTSPALTEPVTASSTPTVVPAPAQPSATNENSSTVSPTTPTTEPTPVAPAAVATNTVTEPVTPSPASTLPTPEKPVVLDDQQQACQSRLNDAMGNKTILFNTASATISTQSYPVLNTLSSIIKECANALGQLRIEIGGHTDSDGDDNYNQALSNQRAEAVKRYLSTKGVKADLLNTRGYGESQPIGSNLTREGRAQNRRIEFKLK